MRQTILNSVSCALSSLSFLTCATAQSCWQNTSCSGPSETAFPGEWEATIYAPDSRTVSPVSFLSLSDASIVSSWPDSAHLQGNGSAWVFDFGKEVGGIVTVDYAASGAGALGLAFSEAKNWIGLWSDSSDGSFKYGDGAIYSNFTESGNYSYTMDLPHLRGGFRYLTLFIITNETSSAIDVGSINLDIGFQPTWPNLRVSRACPMFSNDNGSNLMLTGLPRILPFQ